jgi:hypothetical protein
LHIMIFPGISEADKFDIFLPAESLLTDQSFTGSRMYKLQGIELPLPCKVKIC